MALAQQVEDALKRLVRQTLVQKNGDIYVFLTDEEQEINRAIESQNVDSGEVIAKVSEMILTVFMMKEVSLSGIQRKICVCFQSGY